MVERCERRRLITILNIYEVVSSPNWLSRSSKGWRPAEGKQETNTNAPLFVFKKPLHDSTGVSIPGSG
jgi:hypothetical protein